MLVILSTTINYVTLCEECAVFMWIQIGLESLKYVAYETQPEGRYDVYLYVLIL